MGRSSNYSQQILKDNQKYQNELIECHKLIKSQKLQIQLLEDENKLLKKSYYLQPPKRMSTEITHF